MYFQIQDVKTFLMFWLKYVEISLLGAEHLCLTGRLSTPTSLASESLVFSRGRNARHGIASACARPIQATNYILLVGGFNPS